MRQGPDVQLPVPQTKAEVSDAVKSGIGQLRACGKKKPTQCQGFLFYFIGGRVTKCNSSITP